MLLQPVSLRATPRCCIRFLLSCKHEHKSDSAPPRFAGADTAGNQTHLIWQFKVIHAPPPSSLLMLKSRAICARSLPALLVAYACTAPPSLQSRTCTSGPIRRISFLRLVHEHQSCSLPPVIEIRNCIPLIRKFSPACCAG